MRVMRVWRCSHIDSSETVVYCEIVSIGVMIIRKKKVFVQWVRETFRFNNKLSETAIKGNEDLWVSNINRI
jgi:hypothetical protein